MRAIANAEKEVVCKDCVNANGVPLGFERVINALPHGIVCHECGAVFIRDMTTLETGWSSERIGLMVMAAAVGGL